MKDLSDERLVTSGDTDIKLIQYKLQYTWAEYFENEQNQIIFNRSRTWSYAMIHLGWLFQWKTFMVDTDHEISYLGIMNERNNLKCIMNLFSPFEILSDVFEIIILFILPNKLQNSDDFCVWLWHCFSWLYHWVFLLKDYIFVLLLILDFVILFCLCRATLDMVVANHFPLKSTEFSRGSPKYNDYIMALNKVRTLKISSFHK